MFGIKAKEVVAMKVITGIISQWGKIVEKLEKAIDALREVISENKAEMAELEDKNKLILLKIEEAEKFKSNVNKILN